MARAQRLARSRFALLPAPNLLAVWPSYCCWGGFHLSSVVFTLLLFLRARCVRSFCLFGCLSVLWYDTSTISFLGKLSFLFLFFVAHRRAMAPGRRFLIGDSGNMSREALKKARQGV